MADNATPYSASAYIETLLKIAGAVVLALYVLGLVAINGYLFSLGASDYSLVRARFIYTGGLVALCGLVCLLSPVYFFRLATLPGIGLLPVRALLRFAGLILPIGLLVLSVTLAYSELPFIDALKYVLIVDALALAGGWISALALGSLIAEFQPSESTESKQGRSVMAVASYFILVMIIVVLTGALFVASFMYLLFPHIPTQFGGGRPIRAVFLIKHDEIEGVQHLGLPVQEGAVTGSVELMYEGSEAYIIRLTDRRIIRLNSDAVVGLRIGT
jgi:hypothetical protein